MIHAADVCVVPHRLNRLTMAMSPLKLYEYLAGGRPVAASDLPAVRAVDPRIVLVQEGTALPTGWRRRSAVDRSARTTDSPLSRLTPGLGGTTRSSGSPSVRRRRSERGVGRALVISLTASAGVTKWRVR